MNIKIETYLPIFSGFYGTIFEPCEDDEIADINNNRRAKGLKEITYDGCTCDYPEYREMISKQLVLIVEHELKDILDCKIKLNYQGVYSPKEYNYSNDSINIEIVLNKTSLKVLKEYLIDNRDDFSRFTKERYTSRDGFCSSYSPHVDVWLNENFSMIADSSHILGSILDFVLSNDDISNMTLYESLDTTTIGATNYNELIGE